MATANMKAEFKVDIKKVWDVVTSCTEYEWRSDLSKIEVVEEGKKFVEYTKDCYATEFTITVFEPYKCYEFDMENSNMKGHWTGVFAEADGVVTIDFTEEVYAKKVVMKPFVGMYLKKQQAMYLNDLKRVLGEENRG